LAAWLPVHRTADKTSPADAQPHRKRDNGDLFRGLAWREFRIAYLIFGRRVV